VDVTAQELPPSCSVPELLPLPPPLELPEASSPLAPPLELPEPLAVPPLLLPLPPPLLPLPPLSTSFVSPGPPAGVDALHAQTIAAAQLKEPKSPANLVNFRAIGGASERAIEQQACPSGAFVVDDLVQNTQSFRCFAGCSDFFLRQCRLSTPDDRRREAIREHAAPRLGIETRFETALVTPIPIAVLSGFGRAEDVRAASISGRYARRNSGTPSC
jgi:hypothetical protein